MQVCLHELTLPEVHEDYGWIDLENCPFLAVTMQDGLLKEWVKSEGKNDTPIAMETNLELHNDPKTPIDWW